MGDLLKPETGRALLKGGAFDRILLDAPCSNTGVLRRRADARWRFKAETAAQMATAQGYLMNAVSAWVKPGGRLVYSTCSIEPEECAERVRSWVDAHPGWSCLKEELWLPGEHAADGSYAALLARGEL